MNHHYLRSLSHEVTLANAGFNARHWQAYEIPRSRGSALTDNFIKRPIEWIFPDVYAKAEHARKQFNQRSHTAGEQFDATYDERLPEWARHELFGSETNHRFLENIIEMTFFWLQDAVVLLREHPHLADVDPWRTFLSDATNRSDLKQLSAIILREEAQAQVTNRTELLRQDELLKTVRDGVQLVVPQLDGRLSRLPGDLRGEMEAVMLSQFDEMRATISSGVQSAMVLTVQKMAAGLGSPFPNQGYRNGRTGPIHHRRYTTAATQPSLHRCRYTTAATQPPLHHCLHYCRYTTAATPLPLRHCSR